jgi:hypothetical protein
LSRIRCFGIHPQTIVDKKRAWANRTFQRITFPGVRVWFEPPYEGVMVNVVDVLSIDGFHVGNGEKTDCFPTQGMVVNDTLESYNVTTFIGRPKGKPITSYETQSENIFEAAK